MDNQIQKYFNLFEYSNPDNAQKMAVKYLGPDAILYPSTRKTKKYMILDPETNKWIHFGQFGMEDFLKHQNLERRRLYRLRAENIKGEWKKNKYSPNNLSINILW